MGNSLNCSNRVRPVRLRLTSVAQAGEMWTLFVFCRPREHVRLLMTDFRVILRCEDVFWPANALPPCAVPVRGLSGTQNMYSEELGVRRFRY